MSFIVGKILRLILIYRCYFNKEINRSGDEFYILNSFRLLGLKRKLAILCPVEGIFELHSRAMVLKKGKNRIQKGNFLAN